MDVVLRYFDGCPNWQVARARLAEALDREGLGEISINLELLADPDDAERLGFAGSPTILLDGEDPFAEEDAPVGFSCRIFRTEVGLEGSPSVRQLRQELRAVITAHS